MLHFNFLLNEFAVILPEGHLSLANTSHPVRDRIFHGYLHNFESQIGFANLKGNMRVRQH